ASRQQAANRPRLLQAVIDALQQQDIRKKLLFTGALLIVFRFVAHIPIPDVDPRLLQTQFDQNKLLGLFNLFSGGALRRISIAALGVYPYITETIIMQMVTPLFPMLQHLQQEGAQGSHRRGDAVPREQRVQRVARTVLRTTARRSRDLAGGGDRVHAGGAEKDPCAIRKERLPRRQDVPAVRAEPYPATRELRRDDPADF